MTLVPASDDEPEVDDVLLEPGWPMCNVNARSVAGVSGPWSPDEELPSQEQLVPAPEPDGSKENSGTAGPTMLASAAEMPERMTTATNNPTMHRATSG